MHPDGLSRSFSEAADVVPDTTLLARRLASDTSDIYYVVGMMTLMCLVWIVPAVREYRGKRSKS